MLRERVEKREAEKLVKHVIKAAVKLGVLRRHGQLSPADERALGAFRAKFHVRTYNNCYVILWFYYCYVLLYVYKCFNVESVCYYV